MTRSNKPVGEDDLTAYVDGELSPERRALVEEWLVSHPEDRRRVEADRAIKQKLADDLGPLGDTSLPGRFRVETIQKDIRSRRLERMQTMAAAAALVVLSGTAGWFLRGGVDDTTVAQKGEVQVALAAHRVFVPEKLHPVEVSAESSDHLGKWLGNRIGKPVSIPDLSSEGLTLMGGRLLPGDDGRPAGQLMYETEGGERVTLFLQSGYGDETAFVFSQEGGNGTLAWRSPELAYVLTGPADRNDLMSLAHAVHEANL